MKVRFMHTNEDLYRVQRNHFIKPTRVPYYLAANVLVIATKRL